MNDVSVPTTNDILDALTSANLRYAKQYPGERPDRQPVHTVYGGGHLFERDVARHLGELAIESLNLWAPDPFTFARAIGLPGFESLPKKKKDEKAALAHAKKKGDALRTSEPDLWLACAVYDRVRSKLEREPVEDFRIDFEDGFGVRPDEEEDRLAIQAAEEVARGHAEGVLPAFIGIRIKPLNEEMKRRAVRTLELFFATLAERSGGNLPPWLCVTLPKVPIPEQVSALSRLLERIEKEHGYPEGAIKIELMIELTQSIFDAEGRLNLPRLLQAGDGRVIGAHFGTYDYTASATITAAHQSMAHPACQLALGLIKIAYSYTGIFVSDGATNIMPVPVHREGKIGKKEKRENERAVHNAWATSYRHIHQSMQNGLYQGWDMHPAQLPVRYGATYAFFLRGFDAAATRLRNFVDKAAQATLVGEVFDDAATGQALLNYFLRAMNCGAVSLDDLAVTGLTVEEIQSRSFVKILKGRTDGAPSIATPG
jgi:citrate lyase beta subunit